MKKKKSEITEENTKIMFIMCIFVAVLLLLFFESSRAPYTSLRLTVPTGGSGPKPLFRLDRPAATPLQPQPARPIRRGHARAYPEYPWDETDKDLLVDIKAAQRALSAGVPAERILDNERVDLVLGTSLALLDKEVPLPFHLLLKSIGGCNVRVVADRDAWQRQPAGPSKGGIWPLSGILSELDKKFGVKHVIMKDRDGKACLFLLGPQTRD